MTDYMKEAERLLGEYADARVDFLSNGTPGDIEARAALLAHIQRGAVPEGWQLVPIDPSPGMLDAAEAVDWGDEDTRGSCCNQWHAMLAAAPDHFRNAAEMVVAPAADHEFSDSARAALLWVLWHHQGGSSPVGQPIRFALGMGQHEHLNDWQVAEAKRWGELRGEVKP